MTSRRNNSGFSLAEVLIALAVLTVGMLMIAGVFPVAIYYGMAASEKAVAPAIADEAFAKIKIYARGRQGDNNDFAYEVIVGNVFTDDDFMDGTASFLFHEHIFPALETQYFPPGYNEFDEFAWPSLEEPPTRRQFYWSAICRFISRYDDSTNRADFVPAVQVTVFVNRKPSANLRYPQPDSVIGAGHGQPSGTTQIPMPVKLRVNYGPEDDQLRIAGDENMVYEGAYIVDDATGRIYRVMERYRDDPALIRLNRSWDDLRANPRYPQSGGPVENNDPEFIWTIPPPGTGGRNPNIGVYQKVLNFN